MEKRLVIVMNIGNLDFTLADFPKAQQPLSFLDVVKNE